MVAIGAPVKSFQKMQGDIVISAVGQQIINVALPSPVVPANCCVVIQGYYYPGTVPSTFPDVIIAADVSSPTQLSLVVIVRSITGGPYTLRPVATITEYGG